MRKSLVSGILVGFLVLSAGIAHAANKFVLQISDASAQKQTLVLNVANNLEKHYGVGNVDVEIVAFGPGLRLLFADNIRKDRIQTLNMNGVRFSACSNTIHGMSKILGKPPALNSRAKVVPGGVVRIADLVSQGYILIRP
ncbi:MAG: DsrE family protein [Acidiferrobacteraceae bacterium]|jgi:intracellular sulfur oxidation DsrE/DsrF family protein